MTRRDWLGCLVVLAGGSHLAVGATRDAIWDQIRQHGRAGRLPEFDGVESAHFRSLGDASLTYQKDALDLAESFAADAFNHFGIKKLPLAWPVNKLPVVILASEKSYTAFWQGDVGVAEGGSYDLQNNWLTTFDFRLPAGVPRGLGANNPRLNNTLTLVHELFHLVSYNTGLLDRRADVPDAISEGLSTYAETWGPKHRSVVGAVNLGRRRGLDQGLKAGVGWIAVPKLLASDDAFRQPETVQVAYAIADYLIHRLLADPTRLGQFRGYLDALKNQTDPARRMPLLTEHFGDLDKLDVEVRRLAGRR